MSEPVPSQIVHKNLYTEVVRRLVNAYKQVKIGNPLDKGILCGPLNTTGAVHAFKEAVAEAKALVSTSQLACCYTHGRVLLNYRANTLTYASTSYLHVDITWINNKSGPIFSK